MATRRGGAGNEFQIVGLREFQRELKNLGGEFPSSLRKAHTEVGNKVIRTARDKARRPQQEKAAESLRSSRSSRSVAILLGDNAEYAFAYGAEFGARQYKQFPPWRGNQWRSWGGGPGYFLHPAIREVGENVMDDYWESLRSIAHRAFPD